MAKRKWTSAWARTRQMAWRRDKGAGARCWICGGQIDYTAQPSTTDESWEPDHYLPVARHPEFECDLGNVRPSHRRCNRERGTKAGVDDLGNRSREW